MSTNITGHEVLYSKDFGITGANLEKLYKGLKYDEDVAEICFLSNLPHPFQKGYQKGILERDRFYKIETVEWAGSWSGRGYSTLTDKILPFTSGEADIVYYWEDGAPSGVRVRNGVVTNCDVVLTLKDRG